MKKLISMLLALTLCLSVFAGAGLIASADDELDRMLNATGGALTFVNDAEHPWAQDTISLGKYGASSGNAGADSSSSAVSSTITFGEGEGIFFTWRVSSQEKWDYLAFSVDGVERARISGDFGPESRAFAVEAGEHVVAWTYVKDESYALYQDKAYLDDVYVGSYSASAENVDSLLNPAGALTFVNDASEPWVADGASVARSGNAGKSASESAVTLNAALEAGKSVAFFWGVSSEPQHDFLIFEVNGEEIASISGEVSYPTSYSFTVPADGDYTFRWIYRKDTLGDFGSDKGQLGNVRVVDFVPVTGIITAKNTTVAAGKTLKLTYAMRPTNATNRAVTWSSDNESVAVIDAAGVVTGVSAGTANITVTTAEGGFSSVCALTVTPFAGDYTYYVDADAGNDRNNGKSAAAAFRTLSKAYSAVIGNVGPGESVKLVLTGAFEVREELRIFDKEVNIVSAAGTASIKRAAGYRGPLFRVNAGGILRFGGTEEEANRLVAGNSAADAPCVLVDGGGLTVNRNAEISGNSSSVSGAGVYVKTGSFTLNGGSIANNTTARYGGGVYAEDGSVTVESGSVSGNAASIYGGGAYIAPAVGYSIDESLFSGNTAESFNDICYGEPPAAPVVSGVEDGAEYSLGEYSDGVSASWTSQEPATATLNGEPYEQGTPITEEGGYVLTVTDGFSVVTVTFRIVEPVYEELWVEAFLSDNASGETGWVGFDMNGHADPVRYAIPEKPVAAAVYLAGKVYGYSEDGYFFTVDMDEELPEGAARYSNTVWSDEPVISDYTVLDMTYDYYKRETAVLLADDDNVRYVAIINRDGTIDHAFPVYDAAEQDETVSPLLMTIACSAEGYYYGISGGERAALWMLTGADENGAYVSKLFDMEGEAYYLQSMAFDLNTNTLYWAQCGRETGSIYRVDIEDEFLGCCGSPLGMDAELTALLFIFDIDTSEEHVTEDGRFKYAYLPEGGVEITGYNFKNDGGEPLFPLYDEDTFLVEVPEQINGMDVLSIGKYAFRDRSVGEDPDAYMQIGKAVLPESVETVGYGAFRGCVSLKEIEFGGQEREIGDYAFYQCRSLTDVCIPWPAETIGYGAFSECAGLEKVTVSGPTENIGDYAFYNVSENFELWGHWPSATYDYAQANGLTFRDLDPYEAPVVSGVEEGGRYALSDLPEGVAITWTAMRVESAALDGEAYEEGTPVTALGDHVFTITDGRTEVTVNFTVVETAYMKGDFNGNGKIEVDDALAALRIAAKLAEETPESVLIGDVDGDGHVTVADALAILRVAAKLADQSSLG